MNVRFRNVRFRNACFAEEPVMRAAVFGNNPDHLIFRVIFCLNRDSVEN